MVMKGQKKVCDICGGTGQVSYFKGVSRFLLSTEECVECAGTGYQLSFSLEETRSNKSGGPDKEEIKKKK
jgi:DnaJ-class molecular chaperone